MSAAGGEEPTQPPRLLVVDDEAAQLRALCDSMDATGYAASGFGSARAALAAMQSARFELLLTDLTMPEMDGIALISAARQIDPDIAAIVMTGHGTVDTAVQAMKGGALDYILKPFKLSAVFAVIERALALRRLRRENAALQESERRRTEELAIAYRDLEAFSYSISHDLRAPLRAIQGFAQVLDEEHGERLDDEGRRVLRIVRDGSATMDRMIVGLLAFARAGRQEIELASVDMTTLARAGAAEALNAYQGPEPRLAIDPLPSCRGDATVLRQVWCNLIGNALKYSVRRAQPNIHVRGRTEGREHVYEVQDNGAGFEMRYAAKLFRVFQRLHAATDFDGTGVGLAIVQRIIERHGGRIWAEGEPDRGARFQFALPA